MKIYYITRTYPDNSSGGAIVRKGTIDHLKVAGFEVWVVAPNYKTNQLIIDSHLKHILVPLDTNMRIAYYLEKWGIWDDYLKKWTNNTYNYLYPIVGKDDILFTTSGGELGSIIIGHQLKSKLGCKFIINFHDPLAYSVVNGKVLDDKFHVSREKKERKYCKNADLIICSSEDNAHSLSEKYPDLKSVIKINYFGYIENIPIQDNYLNDKLSIAYGGNFSPLQVPELLGELLETATDVDAFFIGKYENYKPVSIYKEKFNFISNLSTIEYYDFLKKNVNVGFVSLANNYLGACVPSKIYDYINLGLPILGALPEGDAMNIINQRGYGIACRYDDKVGLLNAVNILKQKESRLDYRKNILKDKEGWAMEKRIKDVIGWIQEMS